MPEIQSEKCCSYIPGYYATISPNHNPIFNNLYCSDNKLKNGNCSYGSLMPLTLHHNDTEILRQKILQHEVIFRYQIHELHRLYNKQRELMNEKRSQSSQHHQRLQDLQSDPIFSLNSFLHPQKMQQVSSFPWLNPEHLSLSGAERNKLVPNYVVETASKACDLLQTGYPNIKPELSEYKCKRVGKKMLDLERPADEYIDSEEEESLPKDKVPDLPDVQSHSSKAVFGSAHKSVVEPYQVIHIFQEDHKTQATAFGTDKCSSHLNEPASLDKKPGSVSGIDKIMLHDFSGKPNSDFQVQPKNTTPVTCKRGESSFVLNLKKNKSQQEWLSDNDEAGPSSHALSLSSGCIDAHALSSSSEDTDIKQACETSTSHLFDQSGSRLQGKRKPLGLECFDSELPITNTGQVAIDCGQSSNQVVPLVDVMKYEASSFLSWIKNNHHVLRAPVAVQALPCFTNERSNKFSSFGISSVSRENSQSFRDPQYNHIARSNFCKSDNKLTSGNTDSRKQVKSSVNMLSTGNINHNSVFPGPSEVSARRTLVTDGDLTNFRPFFSNHQYSSHAYPAKIHKNLLKDNDACNVKKGSILDVNLDCSSAAFSDEHLTLNNHVVENRICKKHLGFQLCFDLNPCRGEDAPPQSPGESMGGPASPENRERLPPRGDSNENLMDTVLQLSGKERQSSTKEQDRIAAETIVAISSNGVRTCAGSVNLTSEALQLDALNWFAEISSFVADDPESDFDLVMNYGAIDRPANCLSSGMDYSEAMTQKLKETKVEESYKKIFIQMEETINLTSLITKPRNSRTRRGKQRQKDFQGEILPSLVSLSRCEVKEDLHAFGGVVKDVGICTRKRCIRGRRRRRLSVVSSSDSKDIIKQQNLQNELAMRSRVVGWWEKVTRRRRGQRCRASKPGFSFQTQHNQSKIYPVSNL
ncbi:hypothetical protein K2173_019752 [Erythroxylum novogranatense]|uniref:Uncharacterized protein n=1 Tax=Erythroxylum novogranatense TaxID=1862640 RepID=A0AAV8SMT7_9ROSI|nr:hypothetical protein K2173_019752 [Erythroxylum novogranatense]